MVVSYRTLIATVLLIAFRAGHVFAQDAAIVSRSIWSHVRAFEQPPQGNPELDVYLQTLTREEMITCARQACEEAANSADFATDGARAVAGELYTGLCLEYFFGEVEEEEGARMLLQLARRTDESPYLRRAIVMSLHSRPRSDFTKILQGYAHFHAADVAGALRSTIDDDQENVLLRQAAISALATMLRREMRAICLADPNIHATNILRHDTMHMMELVRSGQLSPARQTTEAFEAVEAQILSSTLILARIVCAAETEPLYLREHAKRALEIFRTLLADQSGSIENVLQQGGCTQRQTEECGDLYGNTGRRR